MPLQRLLRKVAETSKTTLRNFTSPPPPLTPTRVMPDWLCFMDWDCFLVPPSLPVLSLQWARGDIDICVQWSRSGVWSQPGQQTLQPAYNSTDGWVWLDMMVTMLLRQFTRLISPLLTLVLDSPKSTMVHWMIQAYQTTQVLLGSF